jgi:hypothetical protein
VTTAPRVGFRCSDAARERHDPMFATAPPAARFLLVEVPGPWGRSAPSDSRLDRYASGRLADRAERAGVRILLVRRPGRHALPPPDVPRAWAVVETRSARQAVRRGVWCHEHELLEVDLDAEPSPSDRQEPQHLALVCTQGRHDLCCAVRGRPVALELARAAPHWEVWECSHVGGDRFAANLLLLPSGEMFGGLDPASAVATLKAFDAGRIDLQHHRGRVGRPVVEQAAIHHVAVAAGLRERDALRVVRAEGDDGRWTTEVSGGGRHWRVDLVARWSDAARLTCSAAGPEYARRLDLERLEELPDPPRH